MVLDISLPGFLEDLLRYTLYSSFLFYNQYRIFYMCNQINSSSSTCKQELLVFRAIAVFRCESDDSESDLTPMQDQVIVGARYGSFTSYYINLLCSGGTQYNVICFLPGSRSFVHILYYHCIFAGTPFSLMHLQTS